MDAKDFFRRALAAVGRGETLRDIGPFRALAASATRRWAPRRASEVEDLAQDLLEDLVTLRRKGRDTWRALSACGEVQLRARLARRLKWMLWDRAGRDPDVEPLDWLSPAEEPSDAGEERRIRRGIDGGRMARQALARLTEREAQVVALRAEGMSAEEIAKALGVGRTTVYEDQKSVARKLEGHRPRSSRGTRREAVRQLAAAVATRRKGK